MAARARRMSPLMHLSQRVRCCAQGCRHADDDLFPARPLLAKLLPSCSRERIEFRAPVVLRRTPLCGQESAVFETVQGGVERSLLDGEVAARDLFDAQENPVAMLRPERRGLENEQIDGAGQTLRRY